MENNIYFMEDLMILNRIGEKLKANRLRQNIMQQNLADASGVSLSTLKKLEKGEIASFGSLLKVLRALGMLEALQPLIEEDQLSPKEYYDFVYKEKRKQRKRASS